MSAREKITKLEALLARVQTRAAEPRAVAAVAVATVAPAAVADAVAEELALAASPAPPAAEVAAAAAAEAAAIAAEAEAGVEVEMGELVEIDSEVVEIDEAEILAAEAAAAEAELLEAGGESPPSSRRPRPLEAIAESQQASPPHPAPPESGKLVAAAPVPSFDDDFTGVREASQHLPPLSGNEPQLEVQSIKPPEAPVRHEMEAELTQGAPGAFAVEPPLPAPAVSTTRPVSDVAPAPQADHTAQASAEIVPEHVAARMPSGEQVAVVVGDIAAFRPATFGELLDATLGL